MMTLLVNIIGILFIVGIIAWFWLGKTRSTKIESGNQITITVKDGVYQPANIEIPANQPITLQFIREDASPCAEMVIFNELNISQKLPLHQKMDIVVNVKSPGTYEFTCQMGMYRGKLIVR